MKYIPDKNLYSAVMFALRMCPSLQDAIDQKIKIAADYYHVDHSDVLEIVQQELWERAINKAKEEDEWFTIYNTLAPRLLNTSYNNNFIFICPRCGARYSCNVHDDLKINKLYISQCKCGFADEYQRKYVRKDYFDIIQEEIKNEES